MIRKWPTSLVVASLVFIFLSALTGKILMISKTPFHASSVTFGSTFIFGPLYLWQKFINYQGKTNETKIPRAAVVFSLGIVCVYVHVGDCVSQEKINK